MTEKNDGVYVFIEQLEKLTEMCDLFKSLTLSSEIMSEMPLTDEQVEVANTYLKEAQEHWEDSFIEILEFLLLHLTQRRELRKGFEND